MPKFIYRDTSKAVAYERVQTARTETFEADIDSVQQFEGRKETIDKTFDEMLDAIDASINSNAVEDIA